MKLDKRELDATECVVPFVEIVNSTSLGAFAKHAALTALRVLFERVITCDSPRIGPAVNAAADAAIHLRMPMASSEQAELVLDSVLQLLMLLSTSDSGQLLTDEIMWNVSQCIFRLHERQYASQLFQHRAEESLVAIYDSLFSRFPTLVKDEPDSDTQGTFRQYGLPVALKLFNFAVSLVNPDKHGDIRSSNSLRRRNNKAKQTAQMQGLGVKLLNVILCAAGPSLALNPAMLSLLKDDMCRNLLCIFAVQDMHLLGLALEAFDHLLVHYRQHLKTQIAMIFEHVYMTQLASQSKNPESVRLRMILDSLADLSARDWFWMELYSNYDCDPRCPSLLEPLCAMLSKCAFPVYNVMAKMHELHAMQLTAMQCLLHGVTLLVCNGRIGHVNEMAGSTSLDGGTAEQSSKSTEGDKRNLQERGNGIAHELRALRAHKLRLQNAVELFNKKPKHGIRELERIGVLMPFEKGATVAQRAVTIADFIRNTSGLEKDKIGELLGSGEASIDQAIRQSYVDTFNIAGQSTVSSLRMFLGAFRLPGEAQQIDRILQTFAKSVFACSSDRELFATADVAYLLSFSIIMLNTDLHNPNIKPERKMTLSQFVSQNKDYGNDVSQGKVLPLNFLVNIYNSIKSSEFETHNSKNGRDKVKSSSGSSASDDSITCCTTVSDDAWRDMLLRTSVDPAINKPASTRYYLHSISTTEDSIDCCRPDVFQVVQKSVSSAMTVVLETTTTYGSTGIEDALEGLLLLARGAVAFKIADLLDHVLVTLKQSMNLPQVMSPLPIAGGKLADSAQSTDSESSTTPILLPLSSRPGALLSFGCNHKAHMACMAFFGIARQFSGSIGVVGWDSMIQTLLGMWQLGMIPKSMLVPQPMRSTSDAHSHFLEITKAARTQIQSELGLQRSTSSGLFSWLFATEDDEESNSSGGFVFHDGEGLSLSQRLDHGPIPLEELAAKVKERALYIREAAQASPAGTQPGTKRHRQDVQSLSAAVRCITACQVEAVLLCAPSDNVVKTDEMKDETSGVETLISSIVIYYDSFGKPEDKMMGKSGALNAGVSAEAPSNARAAGGLPIGDAELSRHNVRSFLLHTAAKILMSQNMSVPQLIPSVEVLIERMINLLCVAKLPSFAVEVTATSLLKLLRVMIKCKNTEKLAFRALGLLCPASSQADEQTLSTNSHANEAKHSYFGLSALVADALAVYLGFFLHEILADQASIFKSPRAWKSIFDILSLLSKHRRGATQGFRCVCFIMRSDSMTKKVPLSIASTLVDYSLSQHASDDAPANPAGKESKSVTTVDISPTFSAIEACELLFELHSRSITLIKKFSDNEGENQKNQENAEVDIWVDCWRPILLSIARCMDSKYASVKEHAILLLNKAFQDEHTTYLNAQQVAKVFDDLLMPLISVHVGVEAKRVLSLAAVVLQKCASTISSVDFAKTFVKITRALAEAYERGDVDAPAFTEIFGGFRLSEELLTLADATLGSGATPRTAEMLKAFKASAKIKPNQQAEE